MRVGGDPSWRWRPLPRWCRACRPMRRRRRSRPRTCSPQRSTGRRSSSAAMWRSWRAAPPSPFSSSGRPGRTDLADARRRVWRLPSDDRARLVELLHLQLPGSEARTAPHHQGLGASACHRPRGLFRVRWERDQWLLFLGADELERRTTRDGDRPVQRAYRRRQVARPQRPGSGRPECGLRHRAGRGKTRAQRRWARRQSLQRQS